MNKSLKGVDKEVLQFYAQNYASMRESQDNRSSVERRPPLPSRFSQGSVMSLNPPRSHVQRNGFLIVDEANPEDDVLVSQ